MINKARRRKVLPVIRQDATSSVSSSLTFESTSIPRRVGTLRRRKHKMVRKNHGIPARVRPVLLATGRLVLFVGSVLYLVKYIRKPSAWHHHQPTKDRRNNEYLQRDDLRMIILGFPCNSRSNVLRCVDNSENSFCHRIKPGILAQHDSGMPDFGGLEIPVQRSQIRDDDKDEWQSELDDDPDMDEYFYSYEDQQFNPIGCNRPKWAFDQYVNCNTFHELPLARNNQENLVQYLAHGFYRETYRFQPRGTGNVFVLKQLRLSNDVQFDYWFLGTMRIEALLMERLSASPHIGNIFGYCAMSTFVQEGEEITYDIVPEEDSGRARGRISQQELDRVYQTNGVSPFNEPKLSAKDKLGIALQMSKSLAELHGYVGGVIVHDDVFPDQWMKVPGSDNQIFLNDLNNAVVLDWHQTEQRYCRYHVSYLGSFRAPEEYQGDAVIDESADVWPMGNLLFALLTGLWPYYQEFDEEAIREKSLNGERPYLDARYLNRSVIEHEFVNVMNACHHLDPADRIDIFTVVQNLQALHSTLGVSLD